MVEVEVVVVVVDVAAGAENDCVLCGMELRLLLLSSKDTGVVTFWRLATLCLTEMVMSDASRSAACRAVAFMETPAEIFEVLGDEERGALDELGRCRGEPEPARCTGGEGLDGCKDSESSYCPP